MHKWCILTGSCFISSIICFMLAVVYGEVSVGFFLMFPYILGSGMWALLGMMLLFASFFSFVGGCMMYQLCSDEQGLKDSLETDNLREGEESYHQKSKGIILVGPIPFVFGFKNTKKVMIGLFIVMMCIYFLYYLYMVVL